MHCCHRGHVDLTELSKEITHNVVLDLDLGVGQIHMQLCISGTADQPVNSSGERLESQQSSEDIDWDEITAKYVSLLHWCSDRPVCMNMTAISQVFIVYMCSPFVTPSRILKILDFCK